MPSLARKGFEKFLLKDVENLIELHCKQFQGPGKPYSFLTRSGIILLCAAWELYCEYMILECFKFILRQCETPSKLHKSVRKTLSHSIIAEKNELAPLWLAGDGWKDYFLKIIEKRLALLNTPNFNNLIDLFDTFIGIDMRSMLKPYEIKLDVFISKRGEIAHKGSKAGHVSIKDLEADLNFIRSLVIELDNSVIEPVKSICGKQPWNQQK